MKSSLIICFLCINTLTACVVPSQTISTNTISSDTISADKIKNRSSMINIMVGSDQQCQQKWLGRKLYDDSLVQAYSRVCFYE